MLLMHSSIKEVSFSWLAFSRRQPCYFWLVQVSAVYYYSILIFFKIFKELHQIKKVKVAFNGELTERVAVANGVKQGVIPATTLFTMYKQVMLML